MIVERKRKRRRREDGVDGFCLLKLLPSLLLLSVWTPRHFVDGADDYSPHRYALCDSVSALQTSGSSCASLANNWQSCCNSPSCGFSGFQGVGSDQASIMGNNVIVVTRLSLTAGCDIGVVGGMSRLRSESPFQSISSSSSCCFSCHLHVVPLFLFTRFTTSSPF